MERVEEGRNMCEHCSGGNGNIIKTGSDCHELIFPVSTCSWSKSFLAEMMCTAGLTGINKSSTLMVDV